MRLQGSSDSRGSRRGRSRRRGRDCLFWWPVRPAVDGPIILISIDTLRADHLPTYGYTKVRTPAIDALSADGVVFERAYAHAPLTLPSHASIFTGRLPFEHGVRDNIGFNVKQGEAVLSGMLRRNGFSTGAVVSAYVLRKETGIDQVSISTTASSRRCLLKCQSRR